MSRACTICAHPKREEIDMLLLSGEPYRSVAKRYEASEPAMFRHKDHIPKLLLKAKDSEEVAHADNLMAQLREVRQKTLELLDLATKAGSTKAYGPPSSYLAEIRRQIELLAELEGRLASQPQINLQQVNIYDSPAWDAVGAMLARVLAGHPDLKAQVASELQALAAGSGP